MIIKRYANRKLYDTSTGEYITLDQIGEAIERGEEVTVVDHATGADLTAVTMVQVIFEREKRIGGRLPKALLAGLIQTGNVALSSLRGGLSAVLDPTFEQELKRRLKVLVDDGVIAMEEMQRWLEMLTGTRFRQKSGPETVEVHVPDPDAADPAEVDQIQQQISDLEREIERLKAQKQ